MKIKVCGMKYSDNIQQLSRLPIDFMGMIFYAKSPRFVEEDKEAIALPHNIKKVGVFVNADIEYVKRKVTDFRLDFVQLHGDESPEFCKELKGVAPIIKVFSIAEAADFNEVTNYEGVCDLFLFDTKTPQYGGSGQKFDWRILDTYQGHIPFMLSGGVSSKDIDEIQNIKHPCFMGIDLNSKFEIKPGFKDIDMLEQFINSLKK